MTLPTLKEVYLPTKEKDRDQYGHFDWLKICRKAEDLGFKYIADFYYQDMSYESVYSLPFSYGNDPVCDYDAITTSLEKKVVEYLMLPERTQRNRWFAILAENDFFDSGPDYQERTLRSILNNTSICKNGKEKFLEYVKDVFVLEDRPHKYTIEIASQTPLKPIAVQTHLNEFLEDKKMSYRVTEVKDNN